MNKVIRRILSILVCIIVVFNCVYLNEINVYAQNANYMESESTYYDEKDIRENAILYAQRCYIDMVDIIYQNQDEFGIINLSMDDLRLGEPYIIYNVADSCQDAIYYFPIYSKNKIVLVLSLLYKDNIWNESMDSTQSKALNFVNYGEQNCVFYKIGSNIFVENNEKVINLFTSEIVNKENINDEFVKLTLDEKIKIIDSNTKTIQILDHELDSNVNIGYAPRIIYGNTYTYLDMNGYRVTQNGYNICWAASIATIVRYNLGNVTLTAEQVANRMGENYKLASYTGANNVTIQRAINTYGLRYSHKSTSIEWDRVRYNINNRKPIMLSCYSENGGHMVTVTGYTNNKYMKIWDSATENSRLIAYGKSFTESNVAWTPYDYFSYK